MRIISLFSGAGGLDLGLIQAGNDIVWANDIDKDAVATYRENIGNHIVCDDIKNIDIASLPDAEVVVGGFPCQGFSLANRLRTLEDDRNQLYRFFYNTIKTKQPKFFIAENVKGILSLGKGEAIKQIVSDFEGAGYVTTVNLVNMADYGVPQTRQRVLIIGQRKDLGAEMLFQFPKPNHSKDGKELPKWVSIKDAIDHFPDPDKENNVINHIYSAYKVEYSLPYTKTKAMRPLFANAAKCEPDSQGRILLPQKLRAYAGLDKDVVIIGVNDRAEIWSADAWKAQEEEEMPPEKMAACMAQLGF